MRLWSSHPKYLDAKGIVALWREAERRGYSFDRTKIPKQSMTKPFGTEFDESLGRVIR